MSELETEYGTYRSTTCASSGYSLGVVFYLGTNSGMDSSGMKMETKARVYYYLKDSDWVI